MNLPDFQSSDQLWGTLMVAAMILAVITPLVIAILSIRFSRLIKRLKEEQGSNQKILEKRMEVYDRIAPRLNEIYGFFCYVGNWKKLSPPDILRFKREVDKEISSNAAIFSRDLDNSYRDFTLLCFVSRSGWEDDEKIKSLHKLRQENAIEWDDNWIQYFDTNNVVEATRIKERYDAMIDAFKKDLADFQVI